MKAINWAIIAAVMTLTGFGAVNDTLLSVSTTGPDRYADGTTVLDGESYALVWTKSGATFAGFAADGTISGTDSETVAFLPFGAGGRCPTVVLQIAAADAARYADGAFSLYLLDTRLANGKVGGLNANGLPVAVNGWGKVEAEKVGGGGESADASQLLSISSSQSIAVTTSSAVPANAPAPQVTSITVLGDKVYLRVKGTMPCLQYKADEVKIASTSTSTSTSSPVQGAATTDEEIILVMPAKGNSGMYKVGRK